MRSGSSFAALKQRLELLCAAMVTVIALAIAAPVEAGRGISIDNNTFEVWGDASGGQTVALSFPINYGAGSQTQVTVQLPDNFTSTVNGPFAAVGLTFPDAPADALFATIVGGDQQGGSGIPAVMLSNAQEQSSPVPGGTVEDASNFQFGDIVIPDMAPLPPGSCPTVGISTYCYGPMTDAALFQFIDLSSTGSPGDFELILRCADFQCGNIGFNLAGQNFSADDFDPNAPLPPNLVSYTLGDQNQLFHSGTWDFVFRNAAALPEPSTWASMLLGFGLLGGALRRQRKLRLRTS